MHVHRHHLQGAQDGAKTSDVLTLPSWTRERKLRPVPRIGKLVLMLGSLSAVSIITGCAVPTEPLRPAIGIREDSGVFSVIVPVCVDDPVESAQVTKTLADRVPDPSWSATGFTGDARRGIVLGPQDWSSVSGSYVGLMGFSVDVLTRRAAYGTVVDTQADLDMLQSLPSGSFSVNGKVTTTADYAAYAARDFPCAPPAK
jgi:hypothetical protein